MQKWKLKTSARAVLLLVLLVCISTPAVCGDIRDGTGSRAAQDRTGKSSRELPDPARDVAGGSKAGPQRMLFVHLSDWEWRPLTPGEIEDFENNRGRGEWVQSIGSRLDVDSERLRTVATQDALVAVNPKPQTPNSKRCGTLLFMHVHRCLSSGFGVLGLVLLLRSPASDLHSRRDLVLLFETLNPKP